MMSASITSIEIIRQEAVRRCAHRVYRVDNTEEEPRIRERINSPQERKTIVNSFLFYNRSVTKLARLYRATEACIESVIRSEAYRLHPPLGTGERRAA